ncbi:ParB/RepB/Spo0J family partition protein [Agrobacterium tumefaciens]|nr:ParB/RepB/Spo0J family partition protein [Agrobacterium tumefaciens]
MNNPNKKPAGGTNALLAAMKKPGGRKVEKKNIDDFIPDPKQPRSAFRKADGKVDPQAEAALRELADDIYENGLIQPILYRTENGQAIIGVGERRWRAYRLNRELGRPDSDEIECIQRNDLTPAQLRLIQLSENVQRDDLTDLETAVYIKEILEEHPDLKKKDIGQLYKKGGSQYVSRILALLDPQWEDVVSTGIIPYASLLEQYRPLPDATKEELKALAKRENRALTSGDIRAAKARAEGKSATSSIELAPAPAVAQPEQRAAASASLDEVSQPVSDNVPPAPVSSTAPAIDEGLAQQVQELLAASAPQGETYKPSATATAGTAPRENAQPRLRDTGGEPVIPQGTAALSPVLFERLEVRLTLQQLAEMLARNALPNMGHSVSVMLPVADIRSAVQSLGGALPDDDNMVVPTLLDTVNHL